jgi:hypothetical protein
MSYDLDLPERSPKALRNASIIVIAGVLATTLAQPQQLAVIPLRNLLKNELHIGRTMSASFLFWVGFAWYIKPLIGLLSDAFPLFGTRRRSYMLIGAIFATTCWIALAFAPHTYGALLTGCMGLSLFMVISSTAMGGYMVEQAQLLSGAGRLTAVRNFVQQVSYISLGLLGGYLAAVAFHWTAYACAAVMATLIPVTLLYMKEKPVRVDRGALLSNAREKLVNIGHAKNLWAACGLVLLFYFAPGISTAQFYRQQNEMHMTTQMQGLVTTLYGVGGVVASIIYGLVCRRIRLMHLLWFCLSASTLSAIVYVWYNSFHIALFMDTANGIGYTLAELVLMDLCVRSSPIGSEGLAFALLMSVRNFTLFGADIMGAHLMDRYHFTWNTMVIANAVTSAIAIPCAFLLPRIVTRSRDAEPLPEPAAPRTSPE